MNQTGTKSGLGSSRVTNGIRETIYRLPRKDATSLELAELKLELGPLPSSSARPAKSGMRKQADFKVRERSEDLESWCKQDKENGSKAFQSYSNLFRGDADAWTSSEFDWPANAEPKRIMAIESIINPDVRLEKHRIYWDECVSKAAETEMKEEATLAATIENKSDSNQEEYRSLLEEEDSDDESLPPGLEEDDGDSESSDSDDEPQDFVAPSSYNHDQVYSELEYGSSKASEQGVKIRSDGDSLLPITEMGESGTCLGTTVGSNYAGRVSSLMT